MSKNDFHHYHTITGLNGASGLVVDDANLILIADDAYVLYIFSIENQQLKKISLTNGVEPEERITKALKPDFEAISKHDGCYYIFGSGSAGNRFDFIKIKAGNFETVQRTSIKSLYNEMMKLSSVSDTDFNIEAVIVEENHSYFFNRGNGPNQRNGLFKVKNLEKEEREIEFHPIDLPPLDGTPSGFTAACRDGSLIYFIASAESGDSTYLDGELKGSAFGILDAENLRLKDFKVITIQHKIEGISILNKTAGSIEFILCEDADDEINETNLFKYTHKIYE